MTDIEGLWMLISRWKISTNLINTIQNLLFRRKREDFRCWSMWKRGGILLMINCWKWWDINLCIDFIYFGILYRICIMITLPFSLVIRKNGSYRNVCILFQFLLMLNLARTKILVKSWRRILLGIFDRVKKR